MGCLRSGNVQIPKALETELKRSAIRCTEYAKEQSLWQVIPWDGVEHGDIP